MNTAGLGARTSFRFATERRNGLHFLQRALHGTAWHGMTCLQTLRAIGRHGLKLAARPEVQAGPCMGIPAIGMATFAIMCQGRWPRRHGHVWPRRALHRRRRMARRFVWQLAERSICCLPETKAHPHVFQSILQGTRAHVKQYFLYEIGWRQARNIVRLGTLSHRAKRHKSFICQENRIKNPSFDTNTNV